MNTFSSRVDEPVVSERDGDAYPPPQNPPRKIRGGSVIFRIPVLVIFWCKTLPAAKLQCAAESCSELQCVAV